MSKGVQIAIGAIAVALLLGWYGLTTMEANSTFRYYQTLEEFRAAGSAVTDQSLRIHAYVVAGSIERDLPAKQVRFAVQNDPPHAARAQGDTATTLPILFRSLETPDLFKDGAEVVVEGKLDGQGSDTLFLADNVMAKCPSKFQAQLPQQEAVGL